jgi:hypothetical protein|tara:strand:- start:137 stop:286 length:150 start_codon:yes stop_codon:yes gene_type:complete
MKKLLLALGLFLGCNTINESTITKSEVDELARTSRSQISVVGEVFTATW